MIINTNVMALNTNRQLGINESNTAKSLEKLSSGYRINRAGDDAAGLAISEKMRGQIRGLQQASRNAQDGISLIQTAEGALNETHDILQRMRELAVQSANDTNTEGDRAELQKEVDQLAQELTRIANNTEFNTKTLLNGGIQEGTIGKMTFQIGANANQGMELNIAAMDAASLGVAGASLTVGIATGATGISTATIDGTTGAGLVDGTSLTISVADNTGTFATGAIVNGADSLTATAAAVGSSLNGVKITFAADDNLDISTSWDANTNTLTVSADWDNGAVHAPANIAAVETAINTGLNGAGFGAAAITLTSVGYDVPDLAGLGTITLASGSAADSSQSIVTITDGSTSQDVVVSDTALSVGVTSGAYQGLSIVTTNVTSMAGTLTVNQTLPTAAQFASGALTADAVALKGIDISSQTSASSAITTINNAVETVSAQRSKLGSIQNRLEHTIKNLDTSAENLQASESRIRDVDMAEQMVEFTKQNILQQAATAMLAQANQAPQAVLQLLQ
ncbi:flagellin protein flaa [hydrocarbon metagenome]|uniref:Flagellin protein flaa n=1 Tax=hydrocarbon metagenome TaxID=938273 RepID=A0A0W8E0Y2_9ZZZZ